MNRSFRTARQIWLALTASILVITTLAACADDEPVIQQDLTIRLFHARENAGDNNPEGFPPSIADQIAEVRVRVYQNGRELPALTETFDFLNRTGGVPTLPFGENYQLVVEALGLGENQILADGATPVFDYLETDELGEIRVFVSALRQIEYASALFGANGDIIALPSEFEGWDVAARFGLNPEALGGQRAGHTLTELPDGRILAIGGARLTSDGASSGIGGSPFANLIDTVEVYDPSTGYWTILRDRGADQIQTASGALAAPPMRLSVARAFHTATLMGDGRIMVAGGFYNRDGNVEPSTAAEIIDWENSTLEVLTPGSQDLVEPRAMHTAHWVADRVVLVGGVTRTFTAPGFTAGIEAFRPSDGFFDRVLDVNGNTLSLTQARGIHSGTTLGDDGIIVTGGRTPEGITNTIEFLEVQNGELAHFFEGNLPQLATARFGHNAVLMTRDFESTADRPPEYLAVAGGFTAAHAAGDAANTLLSGASPTASVEFFDTWDLRLAPELQLDMSVPRAHFAFIETSVTLDLMAFGGLTVNQGGNVEVTAAVDRMFRTELGGFPLTNSAFNDQLANPRAFAPAVPIETHNIMIVGGWSGGASGAACGQGPTLAGCTSELANPGDLFDLGYLY